MRARRKRKRSPLSSETGGVFFYTITPTNKKKYLRMGLHIPQIRVFSRSSEGSEVGSSNGLENRGNAQR